MWHMAIGYGVCLCERDKYPNIIEGVASSTNTGFPGFTWFGTCVCRPGYERDANYACQPKQLTFLEDLFFCWPQAGRTNLCVSGGDASALYQIYKGDKGALLGTHIGGTRTCFQPSQQLGTLDDFSVYIDGIRVGYVTANDYGVQNQNAYFCSNFSCSLSTTNSNNNDINYNHWHYVPGSANMDPASPNVACECDYGYEKVGNNCNLITWDPQCIPNYRDAATHPLPSQNLDEIYVRCVPPAVIGIPYVACAGYNSGRCIDFIAGQAQPLIFDPEKKNPVDHLYIRLRAPQNSPALPATYPSNAAGPIVGHADLCPMNVIHSCPWP
jgi:hypothetical protein